MNPTPRAATRRSSISTFPSSASATACSSALKYLAGRSNPPPRGEQLFPNFLYDICHCSGTWTMGNFVDNATAQIRRQVENAKVICGLSGGVDSSVTAALLNKAISKQLTCIFVDNGLLRKNE